MNFKDMFPSVIRNIKVSLSNFINKARVFRTALEVARWIISSKSEHFAVSLLEFGEFVDLLLLLFLNVGFSFHK